MLQLFKNAKKNADNCAIIAEGQSYSYQQLLEQAENLAIQLLDLNADLNESRVAFMVNPSFDYVKVQWAIWLAGGIAVPLCISYPAPSLKYVIDDTAATILIADEHNALALKPLAAELGLKIIELKNIGQQNNYHKSLPEIDISRKAMILYTSGTTNLPKGVVTTHANIKAQVTTLIEAWHWSNTDHILCVLPLHHVHGIINVISSALWAGATCEFLHPFSAEVVFNIFEKGKVNLFMAVPTIYFKLLTFLDNQNPEAKAKYLAIMQKFRLMVSGSAALPVSVMEKWELYSGHRLLERYGMTEIGMAISNPYLGERRAGYIGKPLPGVHVRLFDENNTITKEYTPGEIQIKGKNVFLEYWKKPDATKATFTSDGWFKTGDIALVENGYYKILGRDSIDIIKSGGYKISALEIEEVLRSHNEIIDCSVIGIPDEEWGEIIAAVLVVNNIEISIEKLNTWLRLQMAAYKTPKLYKIAVDLPRNAMGKVTKNDLKKLF